MISLVVWNFPDVDAVFEGSAPPPPFECMPQLHRLLKSTCASGNREVTVVSTAQTWCGQSFRLESASSHRRPRTFTFMQMSLLPNSWELYKEYKTSTPLNTCVKSKNENKFPICYHLDLECSSNVEDLVPAWDYWGSGVMLGAVTSWEVLGYLWVVAWMEAETPVSASPLTPSCQSVSIFLSSTCSRVQCHATDPKAQKPQVEISKLWAKINLSSLWVDYLRCPAAATEN